MTERYPKMVEKQLDLYMKEREIMRQENLNITRTLWRTVVGFISSVVLFLGYYFKGDIKKDTLNDFWVMLGATQVAFILFLFAIGIWAAQVVYIGYIKALENRLNELANTTITFWETRMSHRFTATSDGAFYWAWVAIDGSFVLVLVGMFALLVYFFDGVVPRITSICVAIVEAIIIVLLLLKTKKDLKEATEHAANILSSAEKK